MFSAASVLIVEDNPNLIRLYRSVLHKAGFEVYEASSLEQARTLLATFRFGAVICDLEMGRGDGGLEVLRQHRSQLAALGTQIIAISGQMHSRALCHTIGIEFVLDKPVSGRELQDLMLRLSATATRPAIIAAQNALEVVLVH